MYGFPFEVKLIVSSKSNKYFLTAFLRKCKKEIDNRSKTIRKNWRPYSQSYFDSYWHSFRFQLWKLSHKFEETNQLSVDEITNNEKLIELQFLEESKFSYSHTYDQAYHLLPDPLLDKKNIRVPPLRFFSTSVKISFGPPFGVFLYFSWGLNFVYQFISLSHEIQICEEIIWCRYTCYNHLNNIIHYWKDSSS